MRKAIMIAVVVGLSALFSGCEKKQSAVEDPVERGRYLVTIAGCHDCHSPKVEGPLPLPDMTRALSGHPEGAAYPTWRPEDLQPRQALALINPMLTAWAGPWGVSFATNLTPDQETGMGEWTEETFIQAMRTGKHQGQTDGRDILPPMPWFNLKEMTDNDLKAIWAYLQSIPPIKNQVPMPISPASMSDGGE